MEGSDAGALKLPLLPLLHMSHRSASTIERPRNEKGPHEGGLPDFVKLFSDQSETQRPLGNSHSQMSNIVCLLTL